MFAKVHKSLIVYKSNIIPAQLHISLRDMFYIWRFQVLLLMSTFLTYDMKLVFFDMYFYWLLLDGKDVGVGFDILVFSSVVKKELISFQIKPTFVR